MLQGFKLNTNRRISHLLLALFSLAGCGLTSLYAPSSTISEILSIGTGYVALILLFATLLIGPLNLLRKRRNPVNIDLRRDVGIWSGITGLLHVVFSLQLNLADDIPSYFFQKAPNNFLPRLDLFGVSNYVGLGATLILIMLLMTSNQLSLSWLKGKRWKAVQQFNYFLIFLVLLHTFGYQALSLREGVFTYATIAISLLVLAAQLTGIVVTMCRDRQRQIQVNGGSSPAIVSLNPVVAQVQSGSGGILTGRRKFLITTGAAIVGGFAIGIGASKGLGSSAAGASVAEAGTTLTLPTATVNPAASSTTASPTLVPAQPAGRARATTPATTQAPSAGATATQPQNPTTSATATSGATTSPKGAVLATTTSLKPGNAIRFTTPDTGESAFLVCEADGSMKAFSGICTHRPYQLVFNSSQQTLVCNLHSVPFNIKTGAPERSPARTALKSFAVAVDNQGNVTYSHA